MKTFAIIMLILLAILLIADVTLFILALRRFGNPLRFLPRKPENAITGNNPLLRIPDLEPMIQDIKDFVHRHQKEKGYVDTSNGFPTIFTLVYQDNNEFLEFKVLAIRVNDKDELQILFDPDLDGPEDPEASNRWVDVENDSFVVKIPTLFSIAENIEDHVED